MTTRYVARCPHCTYVARRAKKGDAQRAIALHRTYDHDDWKSGDVKGAGWDETETPIEREEES